MTGTKLVVAALGILAAFGFRAYNGGPVHHPGDVPKQPVKVKPKPKPCLSGASSIWSETVNGKTVIHGPVTSGCIPK